MNQEKLAQLYQTNHIYKSIMDKFAAQQEKGLKKYGEYLDQQQNHDRTFFLQHLQEELLDAVVYLEGALQATKETTKPTDSTEFLKPVKAYQVIESNMPALAHYIDGMGTFDASVDASNQSIRINFSSTYGDDDYSMSASVGDWIVIDSYAVSDHVQVYTDAEFKELFQPCRS